MNLNTCEWTKGETLLLPKARMIYPEIFEPTLMKGETDPEKARYRMTLLMPDGCDLTLAIEAVTKVLNENLSVDQQKKTKVKRPFIKTEEVESTAEHADAFPITIRANAKYKPQIVDAKVQNVDDPEQVYGGRWCRISVRPFWYHHPTGGRGISFGLQNVQLLDHGDVIAGGRVSAEAEFAPVDSVESSDGAAATSDDIFG